MHLRWTSYFHPLSLFYSIEGVNADPIQNVEWMDRVFTKHYPLKKKVNNSFIPRRKKLQNYPLSFAPVAILTL